MGTESDSSGKALFLSDDENKILVELSSEKSTKKITSYSSKNILKSERASFLK